MNLRKGFTLIELLVVIAIIGILAAAVLGNLNAARQKGRDASIKSNLSGIRSQAELYFDTNSNYGDMSDCTDGMFADTTYGTTMTRAIAEAIKNSTDTAANCESDQGAGTDDNSWSIEVALNGGGFWCVDSAGGSGYSLTEDAASGVCALD